MCLGREEGRGPREEMNARLRRSIRRRQNAAEIAALEATVRQQQRRREELRAQAAARERRIAKLKSQAAVLELVLAWLEAESLRLGAESKRLRATNRRYKYLLCFDVFLLAVCLIVFVKPGPKISLISPS